MEQCRDQKLELALEEPQDMRFKVQNLSKVPMNLVCQLNDRFESHVRQHVIIQSIEEGS